MSNFPRRSPRFQQHQQQQAPHATQSSVTSTPSFSSFSQSSSSTTTSHPSPTSDGLSQAQQYPLQVQSQFLAPAQDFNAPLPSPSANDLEPFGGFQYNQYNMGGQSHSQDITSSYQNNNNLNQGLVTQQSLHSHHHNSFSQPQRPNHPPTSVNGVPPGLPPDFLAEAAKRAQMACLMRDMGDVSL